MFTTSMYIELNLVSYLDAEPENFAREGKEVKYFQKFTLQFFSLEGHMTLVTPLSSPLIISKVMLVINHLMVS